MTEELKMLTQQAGNTDVRKLEKDDLRALNLEAAALTGVKMAGMDAPLKI